MRKVAITGGLASGKSSVCRILESHGAYVVSADKIVHQLLSSNTAVGQQIVNKLGSDIITNNHLDRKKIAKKVFAEPDKLRELEKILHPKVFEEIERHYEKMKNSLTYTLFAAEVPLLYESKGENQFDAVIAVLSDPLLCQTRFQKEGASQEEFVLRMSEQLSPIEKAAKADFTITNNGSFAELQSQVESLIPKLV